MYFITIFDDDDGGGGGGIKRHVHTPFTVYNVKLNLTFSITIESPTFYALQAGYPQKQYVN